VHRVSGGIEVPHDEERFLRVSVDDLEKPIEAWPARALERGGEIDHEQEHFPALDNHAADLATASAIE
jgi:hypothetical protein